MAFLSKKFKIFGYMVIGVAFYTILLLIDRWDYELTKAVLLRILVDMSISLLGVAMIMELGFFISRKLDIYLPWRTSLVKRILVQLLIQVVVVGFIFLVLWMTVPDLFGDPIHFRRSFITGMILSTLCFTVSTAASFFTQWDSAAVKVAKYEQKEAKAELEFLKMQISPHFLFNNFSTLASLIEEDPQLAVEYVQRLSNIYRHVLKDEQQHVVPLKEELDFIRSYLFLYQTRYQESLVVTVDIPEKFMEKGIARATLQLLVENAIKHNSISKRSPLKIEIFTENNFLVIRNNINPIIKPVESMGIGLRNISFRYELLSNKPITITQDQNIFLVKVPLLD